MGILVDRVKIANYRAIKKLELSLDRFTVLVGANNSGKTTFLRALYLALGEGRKSISKEDFHIENGKFADEIIIDIHIIPVNEKGERVDNFETPWFPDTFTLDQLSFEEEKQCVIFRTRIKEDNHKSNGYSIDRIILTQWDDSTEYPNTKCETDKIVAFESIPLYFIDAQRDVLQDIRDKNSFLGRLTSKIQVDEKKVKEIETLLTNLNKEIIDSSKILTHLTEKLQELGNIIGSQGTSVNITPVHQKIRDIGKGLNIHLREQETESLPLDYHGIGTRSWASLLTLKAFISWNTQESQNEDEAFYPVLALEEPESHLHPNAQRYIISQFLQMEGQKIVSTHSPFIAATCPLSSIRHFYKTNKGTEIGNIDNKLLNEHELKKIKREILNSRGEILFAKCIVLCEGITEEQMLPIFAKEYFKKDSFELGICFVGTGSGTNYESFIRFCRSLNIPWFILGDSEVNIVAQLDKQLTNLNLPTSNKNKNIILLPNNKNIENYLIEQNYIEEIKDALFEKAKLNCFHKKHQEAKKREIDSYDNDTIITKLEDAKAQIAPYIAESIISCSDEERRIPDAFRQLFDVIDKQFGMK
ncbi:MAG: AAA family ATPase [Planctomycetaceae bacterium]|jgi:putative ATP-dependent endonuclease of OLD family|nr:AAA family ATPase [Planctomycetaceae bacterium]